MVSESVSDVCVIQYNLYQGGTLEKWSKEYNICIALYWGSGTASFFSYDETGTRCTFSAIVEV
jgi:hypothetical protein